MEVRLGRHREFLVDRIDPDFGLLDKLLASKTLTREAVHKIKLKDNTTEDKNRLLLDFILKDKKADELITALRDSGQNHLVNYLNADGGYRSICGDDWPLSETEISRLDINRESLVDLLDTSDLCIRLFSAKVINDRQKQLILSKPTNADKNDALLEILRKCSLQQYNTTIACLRDFNQGHIAKLLSDGGVFVRVHVHLESTVGDTDRLEDEIISRVTRDLENYPLDEATRVLEQIQERLRIVAARKGQSIVIYIHCITNDDLLQLTDLLKTDKLKKIIERIFTKMQKIADALRVTLTWSLEEFKRAAAHFDRPHLCVEESTDLLKGRSITPDTGNITERKSPDIKVGPPVKFRSDPALIQTIRSKAAENRNKAILGLAILDKELFVVRGESSKVEVFDSIEFNFSYQWNLKELIHPWDLVSCIRNKCLYIFDCKGSGQSSEILRVHPNGKLIRNWSTGVGYGRLSVTDESNVILASYSQNKLKEYSPDGRLIREINISSTAGICYPWHAIKLTNGHFMFSHGAAYLDPHKVSIVDAYGKLQKSFGGTLQSTIGQMNRPINLSVDGNGFVLVVDQGNNRVLLLDPDLEFMKELLSKEKHGLRFPQRIILDESNGRLLVADNDGSDGRIFIFQFQ